MYKHSINNVQKCMIGIRFSIIFCSNGLKTLPKKKKKKKKK